MFGNNSVPKGGFNAFKAPSQNTASQRPAMGGDMQYPGGPAQPAGQAQSTPQPSKGTPYSTYAPKSSSSHATNTDGVNRTYNTNNYNNSDAGNFGNNPASRPAPFTQGATGLGGQRFSDPSQAFVQRDAMIDRLNTNKSKYTANAGVYQGDGPPPASFGQRPQYDFNSLIGQANDMVQQGWTNPFTQPAQPSQQAFYPGGEGGFPVQPPAYDPAKQPNTATADWGRLQPHNWAPGYGPEYDRGGKQTTVKTTPAGGQETVTSYKTPGGGRATSTVNFGPGPMPGQPSRPEAAQPMAPQQPESYYPGFDPRTQDPYGQPVPRPASNRFRPMPRGFGEVERPPVYIGGLRLSSDPTNGLRQPRERASYGISRRR